MDGLDDPASEASDDLVPGDDGTEGAADGRRDEGNSLTEILIAVTLMGIGVVSMLVGLQTSVRASSLDRDHANAFEWLQAASDAVYLADRVPCTADGTGRLDAIATYDAAAQTASRPPVWLSATTSISVVDVEYLGRSSVDAEFEWSPSFCFEGVGFLESPLYTQRVTIEVTLPSDRGTQTLEMVKSE